MADLRAELETYITKLRERVDHRPGWAKLFFAPKYAIGEAEAYRKVASELTGILKKTQVNCFIGSGTNRPQSEATSSPSGNGKVRCCNAKFFSLRWCRAWDSLARRAA